ncbi:MAG: hypothetical protein JJU29_14590 [Verrucomicrobia bacterium]|nr:hypothetical protein [Verrucomicrobiota bacterium]
MFLPFLATGDVEDGLALLRETLDMIDRNLADELSGRGDQWHLADFAIHAVWRALRTFPDQIPDSIRERIKQRLLSYNFHDGGLTENHDLLHHAMRHLTALAFPKESLFDGRSAETHLLETRSRILAWCEVWLEQGSEEWGADIYENVNLLSLLNLHDFASDAEIKDRVRAALDLLAREMALNAFAGASTGAARRGYGCYRICARNSPSRPLHALWFHNENPDFAVPWFVGGVLVAALSPYRPPADIVALAQANPLRSSDYNTRPYPQPDVEVRETFRVTTRLPGVQLSGTIIPATPSRYTDFTWLAVFDEDAVVLATHPATIPPTHHLPDHPTPKDLLQGYEEGRFQPSGRPGWVPGNMPPGEPGDYRPGFWQGHGHAPACWMRDRCLLNLFNIPETDPCPWFHLHLPVQAFDEVLQTENWLFARRGQGRLRIWSSKPLIPCQQGTWSGIEWRCHDPKGGLFVEIGSGDDWNDWMDQAPKRCPGMGQDSIHFQGENQVITLHRNADFPRELLPERARSRILPNP